MSAAFRCDCCQSVMAADVYRIALDVVRPIEPVEADEDGAIEFPLITFNPSGEFHFCSMGCLSSWAMGEAINAAEVGS